MTAAPLLATPASPGDPAQAQTLDLSVLVLDPGGPEQASLLSSLRALLDRLSIAYEILVLGWRGPGAPADAPLPDAGRIQIAGGYGDALQAGFARARGQFILTMDADLAGGLDFISRLWSEREAADVTIASRYVPGGRAEMGAWRNLCSQALNTVFSRGLDVPIRDVSSGFRLYRTAVLREQHITSRDYDILQQTIVRAFAEGWRVREVPFTYQPTPGGSSHGRVFDVGRAWVKTFGQLWLLRNSILAAEYDERAHDSGIPLLR
jgi:dolichol-phosphate mannosyltransferase